MSTLTYSVESVKKIEEASEIFASITPSLDEAFATVCEAANATGMPKIINAANALKEGYESSFRKVNEQMVATCDEDARLWKALAAATGAE